MLQSLKAAKWVSNISSASDLPKKALRYKVQGSSIRLTFGGKIGHTRDAHRVIQLAKEKGNVEVENTVMESIMKAYFEGDADIISWDDLAEAATRGGWEHKEVRTWMEEGKGGEEIDREVEEADRVSSRGVPDLVIDGKYHIDGALNVGVFFLNNLLGRGGSGT